MIPSAALRLEPPLTPTTIWTMWNADPAVLIPLGVMLVIYAWGIWRLWRHAGIGHGIARRRAVCFCGAVLALGIALITPLDALSEAAFSAHMLQHLVLILAAAPLLVLSELPFVLLWALPRQWAQWIGYWFKHHLVFSRVWSALNSPVSAWLLFTLALWTWHAPALFETALRDETVHAIEHLVFLATGMLFWGVLFQHSGRKEVQYGMAIPYLFATSVQSGIFGALMTFTLQPWYPYYATRVTLWGLTALQDQQLAGLIMWIPGGVVFTLLTIGYFAAWFRALEQRSLQRQSLDPLDPHPRSQ
jgi:putative membrane protein